MKINLKSIVFKVAVLYILITIFNVTIFNIIVWENQTELIMNNAILESQHKGNGVKYILDNTVKSKKKITSKLVETIKEEVASIAIDEYTIFSESGSIIYARQRGGAKEKASNEELRMINTALTKKSFEGTLFAHKLDQKARTISLFIPFVHESNKNAVFHTTLSMKAIDENMDLLYRQCLVISIVIVLIHLIFAAIVSKLLLVPLHRLLHATREISKGNFNVHVPFSGTDELGQLASSFNEMGTAIARMQDEAKGANPLTGLPGNITISANIDKLLEMNKLFAVLYCDLDNFKAYNDKYGFTKGDDAILYSRDKLIEVSKSEGMNSIFVGHEGGDDFVVITPYPMWETYCKRFVESFDRDIGQFYNATDRKNGFIASVNRQGEPQQFPLMSMSIAVVTNAKRSFSHHAELVQVAAEVKKYAKKIEGSGYKLDERSA